MIWPQNAVPMPAQAVAERSLAQHSESSGRMAQACAMRVAPHAAGQAMLARDARRVEGAEPLTATGSRPDLSILHELRVAPDRLPGLAPLIDPNQPSRGTLRPHGAAELAHPEPGFYIAGMKSCGRAPMLRLAMGHEQIRSIVAAIAGDHAAPARVELVLPETGVRSGPGPGLAETAGSGCCGGPARVRAEACCAKDGVAQDAGSSGCGCGHTERVPKARACG